MVRSQGALRQYVHLGSLTAIFADIQPSCDADVCCVTGAVVHLKYACFHVVSASCRLFLALQRDFFLFP